MTNKPRLAGAKNNSSSDSLYIVHDKIHPREVKGLFDNLRVFCVWLLLGLYYILPWIQWDGHQAVLFDLPARKFYIFSLVFWPQDFFYLAWLLIMAGLTLFFVTAVAGRVWCGYACPQTVWTEVFVWMERWTEGSHVQRAKLDRGPWTKNKIIRKTTKQILWVSFSLFTGFIFVSYFTPALELLEELKTFSLGGWEVFWILFYGFATYGNAGFLREQVCKYMCPYARFQSAMFDKDTLIIAYDEKRGEARGSRKRGVDYKAQGKGDCIDCTVCVQVCPTGIDIRDGLQYECIACGACIDACNNVMDKMDYPRNLITYTTDNTNHGKPFRLFRPRIVIYGILLLSLFLTFIFSVAMRVPLEMDVLHDRNSLYRETVDGMIENVYTLKIMNMEETANEYQITVSGLSGIEIEMDKSTIIVDAGAVLAIPVRIGVPPQTFTRMDHTITISVKSLKSTHEIHEKARFLTPIR